MISGLETELVERLRSVFVPRFLEVVDQVPALSGSDLLARMQADAPAIYVALSNGDIQDDEIEHHMGILVVTRSAVSQVEGRKGTEVDIGAYKLADVVLQLAAGAYLKGWRPRSYSFAQDDRFSEAGLTTAVVGLVCDETVDVIDPDLVGLELHEFLGLTSFYDANSKASDADHQAWLAGQPGSTNPDITGNANPEQ